MVVSVREAMKSLGLSYAGLAAKVGEPERVVEIDTRHEYPLPWTRAQKYAPVLGVSAGELMRADVLTRIAKKRGVPVSDDLHVEITDLGGPKELEKVARTLVRLSVTTDDPAMKAALLSYAADVVDVLEHQVANKSKPETASAQQAEGPASEGARRDGLGRALPARKGAVRRDAYGRARRGPYGEKRRDE